MDLISRAEVNKILLNFSKGCLEEKEYGEVSLLMGIMESVANLPSEERGGCFPSPILPGDGFRYLYNQPECLSKTTDETGPIDILKPNYNKNI